RQVMLSLIDQRWRSHLHEMDLLREGIHLRAMGQKDPATEWQREGFDMFGQMMDTIAMDFVRYVMHVQLAERAPADTQRLVGVTANKSEAASAALVGAGVSASQPAPAAAAAASSGAARAPAPNQPRNRVPVVKSELEKVGRNQPCPCGSGKKYKMCHGRPGAS
ncbi:MAG: preprotein translocase subunit SecA, partial [Acidimicrobiaceae bacterium]|nr:preprotein translocase subunit SecA [Acidimicrobiaceae bacterium]